MSDGLPIVALKRVADQNHFIEGLPVHEVPCDDCEAPCWRTDTTPTIHVHQDGTVEPVKNVCEHCFVAYLDEREEIEFQPITDDQLVELRAMPNPPLTVQTVLRMIDAHPDVRLSAVEYLLLAGLPLPYPWGGTPTTNPEGTTP